MTDLTLEYQAATPDRAPAAASQHFRFTGDAAEYFGIWIVNLFLTLVTLGIYSAWAKVRKKRYFYGNTWVAGSNFEYHGNPVAILKGRLVAVAAFVAYTLATQFSPRLGALLLLAMMPAVPWLIVRSMAFNAANSSFRNLRFRFSSSYLEALGAVWPLFAVAAIGVIVPDVEPGERLVASDWWLLMATPLAFAVAYPYVVARIKLLQGNRSAFGSAAFACDARVGAFYGIYLKSAVLAAFAFFVLVMLGMMLAQASSFGVLAVAIPLGYFFLFAMLLAYTRARVANLVFNATRLGAQHRLASTLSARHLARLYATNLLAITASLGLLVPWAAIRTARYRAECLALAGPDLDGFLGGVVREVAATGEEMGEMFDMDLSL